MGVLCRRLCKSQHFSSFFTTTPRVFCPFLFQKILGTEMVRGGYLVRAYLEVRV
jgi:hypothetical protein